MSKRALGIGLAAFAGIAGVAMLLLWGSPAHMFASRPDVPFAPLADERVVDPDNPVKVFRIDMARVEHDYPLSITHVQALTPINLRKLNQEEIDQIYGRLTAGRIPDGPYRGDLFFGRGEAGLAARLEDIFGGLEGRLAGRKVEILERVGRALWKGKMFYRDQRVARNIVEDFKPLRVLIDDPGALTEMEIPRQGWLRFILPTTDVRLMFPAKVYCGQSLLDGRRESIIIDHAYNDELEGYRVKPDRMVGRNGLKIRDEIRMVRPGFYLGRAYINRFFVLNFTLYNAEVAEAAAERPGGGADFGEDCWVGEQARTSVRQ